MKTAGHIAIVAYSGVQMSAVLGLQDLLEIANRKSAELKAQKTT